MFRRKFLTKALAIALSASLVLGSGGFENFGTLQVQAMEQTEELSGQESVSGSDAGKSVSDSDAGKSVSDSDALGSVSGNDASDISEIQYRKMLHRRVFQTVMPGTMRPSMTPLASKKFTMGTLPQSLMNMHRP